MELKRFFECQNCGMIHYGITQTEADKIVGFLSDGFNNRNPKFCSRCGRSYPFIEVSEEYATNYLSEAEVEPWLYPPEADEQHTIQANQP